MDSIQDGEYLWQWMKLGHCFVNKDVLLIVLFMPEVLLHPEYLHVRL